LDAVISDYEENKKKSLTSTKQRIEKHIRPVLGHLKVSDISSAMIRSYGKKRLEQEASAGTVNRELNVISKAFSLADLPYKPKIEKLKESNIRTGFVSRKQLDSIRKYLPDHVSRYVLFLFLTAWRRSEGFNLQWKDVDFETGWVTLEPLTTKNDEGRRFPLTSELRSMLNDQRRFVTGLERKYQRIIPWVFTHEDGEQMKSLRRSWATACKSAGLAHILIHDLRRSGIMQFAQAGIDQQTGMLLSGHKTASVYRRYNIPTQEVLRNAAAKLEAVAGTGSTSTGTATGTAEDSEENAPKTSSLLSGSSGG
jgi:integrase